MPVGYTLIDNITSDEAKHHIDDKKNGSISIEYADFEQELWIELSKSGSWKTITTDQGTQEEKYVYNDYYTLQNIEGSRFVGGRLYDPEVLILNTPENMIKQNSDKSRKILICEETREEIFKTCQNIFRKEDESTWNIKIYDDEIMCYINPLFDLGFDNNVMHPHETNWRMSITATPKTILEKLKAFKKEELSTI